MSRLEMVVLATLSQAKPLGPKKRLDEVTQYVDGKSARSTLGRIEHDLTTRSLVKVGRRGALRITEKGERALRAFFGGDGVPTWRQIKGTYLLAVAAGLEPRTKVSKAVQRTRIVRKAVAEKIDCAGATSTLALCDHAIARLLGMDAGRHSITDIRAFALAKLGAVEASDDADVVATRIAEQWLGARENEKGAVGKAAIRHWVLADEAPVADDDEPVRLPAGQLPLPTEPLPPPPPPPKANLLQAVRDALPRIGVDGRFGPEKVFISAIWNRLQRDHKSATPSLDDFKRWLVEANRKRDVVLARADLVGAMDPKLVAESEIEDLGAAFHFVVDRAAVTPADRRHHAR